MQKKMTKSKSYNLYANYFVNHLFLILLIFARTIVLLVTKHIFTPSAMHRM